MSLTLKPKGKKEKIIRRNIGFKETVSLDIDWYCKCYEETYGQSLSEGELVNDILELFFSKDKVFQEYKSKGAYKPSDTAVSKKNQAILKEMRTT